MATRIWLYLKRNWQIISVIALAMAFFIFASVFNFRSQDKEFVKWLSPDETANYAITKHYAETGSLMFFEKYNLLAKDLIHPRSFRSDWGWIKPVSFIGLPILYGNIAEVFGTGVIPYLTPLFGAIGLVFFYLLIRELFGKTNALISTALASVFPVYIYFSSRSMFHNILFVACLIIGLYFSVKMAQKPNPEKNGYLKRNWTGFVFALLGGLFVGLAVTARTSELLWVGPTLVFLYVFNFRQIGLVRLFFFLYGMLIAVFPVMYWNEVLYGSWRAMGYPEVNSSLHTLGQTSSELALTAADGKWYDIRPVLAKIKMTIFHFGFKPEHSLKMFNIYIKEMFAWLFWAGSVGIALFLAYFRKYSKAKWLFLIAYGALSTVLIIYYGSWVFYDNPDPNSFTIGNSYTRYWLPVYFGALPFASFLIIQLTSLLRQRHVIAVVRLAFVIIIAVISLRFVWLDPDEGLAVSINKQLATKKEWQQVLELTESDSVIITRYHDKVFFPERKIIMGLFNDKNMIAEYATLSRRLPVYYYNFTFTQKDFDYLNSSPLKEKGIRLESVETIDKFTLYRIRSAETE